jgi:methylmalonyl-CoA/ethylmalonyl-CoA epimerase
MSFLYSVDHIGHAVHDIDETVLYYQRNFDAGIFHRERKEEAGIDLAFIEFSNTKIELLAPFREASVLDSFLSSRGAGLHHICYEVENIEAELLRLKSLGQKLIDEEPREGAMGSRIAFLHPSTNLGILVELCEHAQKAKN